MVSCLILYHRTITSDTKRMLLHAIFRNEDCEIEVGEKQTVFFYIRNVDKYAIWQAALEFELTSIQTGYGFGKLKKDAKKEAMKVLYKRTGLDDAAKNRDIYHIEETKASYTTKLAVC